MRLSTLMTLIQNIVSGNIPSIETDNLGKICMGIGRKMVKREDLHNEICGIVNPSDSCMSSSMKLYKWLEDKMSLAEKIQNEPGNNFARKCILTQKLQCVLSGNCDLQPLFGGKQSLR